MEIRRRPDPPSRVVRTPLRVRRVQVLLEESMKPEESETYRNFDRLLKWADQIRTLDIRTNADTPNDARVARLFGAHGIGLCRTEHMFFADERILRVREMILARNEAGRRKALDELLPFQKADFEGIFRALDGMPVTVRLLDPPLHEFLPQTEAAEHQPRRLRCEVRFWREADRRQRSVSVGPLSRARREGTVRRLAISADAEHNPLLTVSLRDRRRVGNGIELDRQWRAVIAVRCWRVAACDD